MRWRGLFPSTSTEKNTVPGHFLDNPAIADLGKHQLWTFSNASKMPVDIRALMALNAGLPCPRCDGSNCPVAHGAQVNAAATQLLTLPELCATLATTPNYTTHLDSRLTGMAVIDIEPDCPPEVTNQILHLATGNTATPTPPVVYSELSSSGKGYHLVVPLPRNLNTIAGAANRIKIQHPKRWFEVLLYHWITFSGTPIPPQRLAEASADPAGDGLTWEGLFAQLCSEVPSRSAVQNGFIDQELALSLVDDELDDNEATIATLVINEHSQQYSRTLSADFNNDLSRWEFSVIGDIVRRTDRALVNFANANALTGNPTVEITIDRVIAIAHAAVVSVIPSRDKHYGQRNGLPYLLYRTIAAATTAELDYPTTSSDTSHS